VVLSLTRLEILLVAMAEPQHLLLQLEAQFQRRAEVVELQLQFWQLVRLQQLDITAAVDLFGQTIFLLLTVQMAMVEIRVAHRSEVVPIQTFKQVVVAVVPEELVRTQLLDQAVMVV
jgi:hypothetical protein